MIESPIIWLLIQALYETSLLAHAKCTPKFEYLSLVVIGSKGYQVLVEMQQLKQLDKSFKKACIKLKQIMNFPTQVRWTTRNT